MEEKNSSFFEKVYEVVKQIPKGKVTTYGAIAKYLGHPKSARMVGWAMNKAHNDDSIPAHRVVNRNGVLTGKHHFAFQSMEKQLLAENIIVEDNKIVDFETHFWTPK